MDNKQNQGRGRKVSCEQAVSEKGPGLLGVKGLSKRQETVTEELWEKKASSSKLTGTFIPDCCWTGWRQQRTNNLQATKAKQHKLIVPSELLHTKIQSCWAAIISTHHKSISNL